METDKQAEGTAVLEKGPDRYELIVSGRVACMPSELWSVLSDFERFVNVGLGGMARDFQWASGGPGEAPSIFSFSVAGVVLKEEVYELTADRGADQYRLRYRALEPALGVLEYDAVLEVGPSDDGTTLLRAVRDVRMAPGVGPDGLVGMIDGEMQSLASHFDNSG